MPITQQAATSRGDLPDSKPAKAGQRTRGRRAPAARTASTPSLEVLLTQAREGDREALLEIYDQWAPRVLGLIRRVLAEADGSEQVLEDVFAQLWRESGRVSEAGASVAAWLMLTARTRAVGRLRRCAHSRAAAMPQPGSASPPFDNRIAWLPKPDAVARIEERRALLQKVLGQLPRQQLKLLESVAYSGRSETELGEELGEPLARVQAELRAAAGFLRHRRRAVVGTWTVGI